MFSGACGSLAEVRDGWSIKAHLACKRTPPRPVAVGCLSLNALRVVQVMGPNAAQLTAAVSALINALVASKFSTTGALGLMNTISYARWALEGYVIAEANCLKGESMQGVVAV